MRNKSVMIILLKAILIMNSMENNKSNLGFDRKGITSGT